MLQNRGCSGVITFARGLGEGGSSRSPAPKGPPFLQRPAYMSYVRSALTYGAIFCLIGFLLLFFGGLLLGGEARLPEPNVGWSGGQPEAAPVPAGVLLAALGVGMGALTALWAQASWGETTAVLVIVAGGFWALGPVGAREAWRVLWQVGWIWTGILEWGPAPGWGR